MKVVLASVLGLVTCTACTPPIKPARLYDLQSAAVIQASYQMGNGHGKFWIGDDCHGEYVTVAQGAGGWGTIFNGGTSVVATGIGRYDLPGRAIMTCGGGRIIECEFIASQLTRTGHGACEDNQQHRYRLMF